MKQPLNSVINLFYVKIRKHEILLIKNTFPLLAVISVLIQK